MKEKDVLQNLEVYDFISNNYIPEKDDMFFLVTVQEVNSAVDEILNAVESKRTNNLNQ